MIRRLRRKFVLINMSLVTIVLLAVLSVLCYSNFHRYRSDSMAAMIRTLETPADPPPQMQLGRGEENRPMERISTFLVVLEDDGEMITVSGNSNTQIDDSFAMEAAKTAFASERDQGTLPDLELRFLKGEHLGKTAVAFADTSHETSSMQSLLLTSSVILAGALTAFFLISLFLSRLALKPVEQAWQQQNQFIADASHELKTPLTVILANLKILLSHPADSIASQARWLQNTQAEAGRMKKLVEDLLFLAKSEAHTIPMEKTEVNFSDLALSCLLPMESLAFEQGVLIHEHIDPNLHILGNEDQLKQLCIILLDNALKYAGKEKRVTVSASASPSRLLFSVKNTGTPIPKEELPHLFERFYRSEKSRVRKQGGYGLGLSIAETIVQNHSGKITVTSTERDGTEFCVTFPLSGLYKNI